MIFDLDKSNIISTDGYDLCVIGSGPSGLAIALEFFNTDKKILVIESGGKTINKKNSKLTNYDNVGLSYTNPNMQRARVLGGSSYFWGGNNIPLSKCDFEKSRSRPEYNWPFDYEEYEKYLDKAEKFLDLSVSFKDKIYNKKNKFTYKNFDTTKWIFCKYPFRLGEIYYQKLHESKNISVILNATFTNMKLKQNSIDMIEVASSSKKKYTIKSKYVVLATGGLENARILLDQIKKKNIFLPKVENNIGKYFAEHPNATIGVLNGKNADKFFKSYDINLISGQEIKPGLNIKYTSKESQKLLNSIISFWPIPKKYTIKNNLKLLAQLFREKDFNFKFLLRLFLSIPSMIFLLPVIYQRFKNKKINFDYQKNVYDIRIMSESKPNINSCIVMKEDKDEYGIYKFKLKWSVSYEDKLSISKTAELLKKDIKSQNDLFVDLFSWVREPEGDWGQHLNVRPHFGHHMGTTRMSEDESCGVVDSNCKVFGIKNLYIAGSSVFPTYGYANPTITIVALSIRLAAKIKRLLN